MNKEVYSASIAGPSHVKRGLACDDSGIARIIDNYGVLVCSDGAGSATQSRFGSRIIVETFEAGLTKLASEVDLLGPGEWIVDSIVELVLKARKNIKLNFPDAKYSDFHSTVVACLAGPLGGFIIHIGDGFCCVITEASGTYSITSSEPENGEYVNETYFLTESNWIKHLRVTPFVGKIVFAATMTDGAHALFQKSGKTSITKIVETAETLRNKTQTIEQFLKSEAAQAVSGDDKTLCLLTTTDAFSFLLLQDRESFQHVSAAPNDIETSSSRTGGSHHLPDVQNEGHSNYLYTFISKNRSKIVAAGIAAAFIIFCLTICYFFIIRPEESKALKDIMERAKEERNKAKQTNDKIEGSRSSNYPENLNNSGDVKNNNSQHLDPHEDRYGQIQISKKEAFNRSLNLNQIDGQKLDDEKPSLVINLPNLRDPKDRSMTGQNAPSVHIPAKK